MGLVYRGSIEFRIRCLQNNHRLLRFGTKAISVDDCSENSESLFFKIEREIVKLGAEVSVRLNIKDISVARVFHLFLV